MFNTYGPDIDYGYPSYDSLPDGTVPAAEYECATSSSAYSTPSPTPQQSPKFPLRKNSNESAYSSQGSLVSVDLSTKKTALLPVTQVVNEKKEFTEKYYPKTISAQVSQQLICFIKQLLSLNQVRQLNLPGSENSLPESLAAFHGEYPSINTLYMVCVSRLSKLVSEEEFDTTATEKLFKAIAGEISLPKSESSEKSKFSDAIANKFQIILKLYELVQLLSDLKKSTVATLEEKFLKSQAEEYQQFQKSAPTKPSARPQPTKLPYADENFFQPLHAQLTQYNHDIQALSFAEKQYRTVLKIREKTMEDCFDHIVNNKYRFYQINIHPLLEKILLYSTEYQQRLRQFNKILSVHPEFSDANYANTVNVHDNFRKDQLQSKYKTIETLKTERDQLRSKKSTFSFMVNYRLSQTEKSIELAQKELEDIVKEQEKTNQQYLHYLSIRNYLDNLDKKISLLTREKNALTAMMQGLPYEFTSTEEIIAQTSQLIYQTNLRDDLVKNLAEISEKLKAITEKKEHVNKTLQSNLTMDAYLKLMEEYCEKLASYEKEVASFNAYQEKNSHLSNNNYPVSLTKNFHNELMDKLRQKTRKKLSSLWQKVKYLEQTLLNDISEVERVPLRNIENLLSLAGISLETQRTKRNVEIQSTFS